MITTLGHALTIDNLSNSYFKIGKYTVSPYECISFGTWLQTTGHNGLWYNLETYYMNIEKHNSIVSMNSIKIYNYSTNSTIKYNSNIGYYNGDNFIKVNKTI